MAYKFQVGPAQLSGALTQEGAGTFEGAVVGETTISASARLSGHDLIIQEGNSIGTSADNDLMTLSNGQLAVAGVMSASADIKGMALDLEAGIDAGVGNFTVSAAGEVAARSTLSSSLVDFGVKAANAGTIGAHFVPDADSAFGLGTSTDRWRYVYADELIGDKINVSELSGALEYKLDVHPTGGLDISAIYDNTEDSEIFIKNVANFTDNTIMVWDASNDQFEDSIMTDDGSLITVDGNLSASGQLDIDGSSTLDGPVDMGSTLDVAGILSASSDAEFATNVSVLGDANFEGNVYLGSATGGNDVVYLDSGLEFSGSVIPETDSAFDLGSDTKRWSTIYVDNIVGADLALDVFTGTSYAAGTDVLLANGNATLLDIASNGQTIRVKNISGGLITVDCDASDTFFDTGTTQIELETDGAAVTLISSGSSWYII